jgi:signal transduction histidine kinase
MTFAWLRVRNSISAQIAAMVVAALVLLHIGVGLAFLAEHRERRPPPGEMVTLIRLIEATPAAERTALLTSLDDAFPRHGLALASADIVANWTKPAPDFMHLPPHYAFAFLDHPREGPPTVAVRLPDGDVVTVRLAPPPPRLLGPFSITLMSIAVCVTLLGLWAARALTRPLRAFAQAAERFSPDGDIAPLPERGPEEVRAAAAALNGMRERIKVLVEDRTRLLAAVGHDLRTPITRLRLRCDFIKDRDLRQAMLRDLAQMQAMAESILSHLGAGRRARAAAAIDLASLAQTVCDEFADLGHSVTYQGPDHATVRGDLEMLHRTLANLVDNAVRYGGGAIVRLTRAAAVVTLDTIDSGPGIPNDRKAAMLEPFVRGEAARSMDDTAGFGLGLSIARAAVVANEGSLTLLDNDPRGLIARIQLPSGVDAKSESAHKSP